MGRATWLFMSVLNSSLLLVSHEPVFVLKSCLNDRYCYRLRIYFLKRMFEAFGHCLELFSLELSVEKINLLKPTGHVMHQQFNIQQLYVLPALYLCVLYLSENKQRLVLLTA